MRGRWRILLTGATGLLGRYLLRNLLLQGQGVAVLARDSRQARAQERIAELVARWSDALDLRLPAPIVLAGDLTAPRLGLGDVDRVWLSSCEMVVHCAARLEFRTTFDEEPWRTNVEGTARLLRLCDELGIEEFHHVSTAFVCGQRTGLVREVDLEAGQTFHNVYEESKCEAEMLVHRAYRARTTIYRPSVIVGDSATGYTSTYHGFYRFLELADRLSRSAGAGRRVLPLRLPFTGDERRNLVPVDWVAEVIALVVANQALQGRTYHLTARQPVTVNQIKEVAERVLGASGASCAGPDGVEEMTDLEMQFRDQLRDYWPYREGDPTFDTTNTRTYLPHLPPPTLTSEVLARLVRFAVEDNWGRNRRSSRPLPLEVDCADYIEDFFPAAFSRSSLAGLSLDVVVALDVRGPGGGQWTCRWVAGEPVRVERGRACPADVVYRLDAGAFADIVTSRVSFQDAFLGRRIEIEGQVEKGLKLAVLFDRFVRESPLPSPSRETPDESVVLI